MLSKAVHIAVHDWRKGNNPFRILWKSLARWKKFGWDGMLEWLDKEIWKIPNQETELRIDPKAYQRWIQKIEPGLFDAETEACNKIRFSIFLRKNLESDDIHGTMESLQRQTHTNWELIRLDRWDEALAGISGSWGLVLDPAILVSPYALTEFAQTILSNDLLALIYADEDWIDADGVRANPHFKCGFNPDMFYSAPYIGKTFVWNIKGVLEMGGLEFIDRRYWESDLVLRIWETMGEQSIGYIPKILFHLTSLSEKTNKFHKIALEDHFIRLGSQVSVIPGNCLDSFRIQWHCDQSIPKVSIIIPTRDHLDVLERCTRSILDKTVYPSYEIMIVDNQSRDTETKAYFERIIEKENVRVLRYDLPFNYSAINNFAATQAEGDIILLLNNDTEVIAPEWLDEMVMHAMRPEIGCVGAMLYYPDDTIQHAGIICGLGDVAGHAHKYMKRGSSGYFGRACIAQNVSAVTGACLAIRKSVFEEAGGLNESELKVAYNDVDLCLRVKARGYRNVWTPFAELYHHESRSRGKDDTSEKKLRAQKEVKYMQDRWKNDLKEDPYYHPALTRIAEQFQLRRI